MIVRMMTHSKTIHLTIQMAALLKNKVNFIIFKWNSYEPSNNNA